MAEDDPNYDPMEPGAPPAGAFPSTFQALKSGWDQYLSDPNNRAAMMSMGLQMMQPIGVGQSALGNLGVAVGKAGEGLRQGEELDIKQQAVDLKNREADSRAAKREADIANAGAALGLKGAGLDLQRQRMDLDKQKHEQRLFLQQQMFDLRAQRSNARTDYERSRLDQQERDLQRKLDALELTRTDVRRTGEVTERQRFGEDQRNTRQGIGVADRQTGRLEKLATEQANAIYERLRPDPLLPASRQPQVLDADKPHVGKTPEQIRRTLLGDKNWRDEQLGRMGGSMSPSTPVTPANSEVDPYEGRTATGPNGERLIRRNGQWVEQ